MKTSNEINLISEALCKAQSEMGNAAKDSKNPFFKSKFADLNAVREASIPVLNKHGISVLQPMTIESDRTFVVTMLLHSSGQYISSLTEIIVPDNKASDPQAHGAAQSYARRYGLQSLVCIGAEDNDAEGAMNRPAKLAESKPSETKQEAIPAKEDTAPKRKFGSFGSKAKVEA